MGTFMLNSAEFAADPQQAYKRMRHTSGPLVTVDVAEGVPATLVIGYRAALRILTDPDHFPADPRGWQSSLPEQCPALPIMEWGPIANSESEYGSRYRAAYLDALGRIDLHALRREAENLAVPLINEFCTSGSADLLGQYAVPLTVRVLDDLLGLSPERGEQVFAALAGLRDAADAEASTPHDLRLSALLSEVVAAKRSNPGADVISWLIADPRGLEDAEIVAQAAVLCARGGEPTWNLIANTVLLMLTDTRFHDVLLGGALPVRDAIDEALFADPPLSNSCVRYPRQPQTVEDVWLPEHQPVIISSTACNADPAVAGERAGNRSHLAWGAGPRMCPAQSVALVIVQAALDQLLDALPDIELAVPADQLTWRPHAFHRGPTAVPVTFPPSPPLTVPQRS